MTGKDEVGPNGNLDPFFSVNLGVLVLRCENFNW